MTLLPIYLPVPLNPEKWEDIPSYEGVYQMSNLFRFRSLDKIVKCGYGKERVVKGKILATNKSGAYPTMPFWGNNKGKQKRVHILIAQKYHSNPQNKSQVNHINGKKHNYHPINLEWNTPSENRQHAFDTGLQKAACHIGENNPKAKLNERSVKVIKGLLSTGLFTNYFIGSMFNVDYTTISNIRVGKTWRDIAW